MKTNNKNLNSKLIAEFLKNVSYDFPIPLDEKVDIDKYSKKILNGTIKFYMQEDKIGAMVGGYTENILNNTAYIAIVAVDKRLRGRGIAKKLIYEFISECNDKGIKSVNLYTHKSNYIAIKMYKELGFREEIYGEYKEYRNEDVHLIYNITARE